MNEKRAKMMVENVEMTGQASQMTLGYMYPMHYDYKIYAVQTWDLSPSYAESVWIFGGKYEAKEQKRSGEGER